MLARWRIELFGGLRASCGERTVSRFKMRRVASLLAYLAYYPGREHPREVLIEMLWPEAEPEAARNRFSVVLSSLRRELEPSGVPPGSVLKTDRVIARLNPDALETDVSQFTEAIESASRASTDLERASCLKRAIELYRGPLLPAYHEGRVAREKPGR